MALGKGGGEGQVYNLLLAAAAAAAAVACPQQDRSLKWGHLHS